MQSNVKADWAELFWGKNLKGGAALNETTPKTTVIRAENMFWRALLRIILITMPYWLLIGGYNLCNVLMSIGNHNRYALSQLSDPFNLLSVPSLFIALAALTFCKTNVIRLTDKKIGLPCPWFCSIKIAELENVLPIFGNGKITHMHFVYGLYRSALLPTNRLEGNRLNLLVQELKSRCQPGVVAKDFEEFRPDDSAQPADGYRIDYRTREKMHRFFKLVTSFEKQFWRAWLFVFLTPAILASPIVVWLIFTVVSHSPLEPPPPFAQPLGDFYNFIFKATLEPIFNGAKGYYELMSNGWLLGFGHRHHFVLHSRLAKDCHAT